MRRRWSMLQSALYNIIDPAIDFQMHCVAYPMRSKTGTGWAPVGDKSVPRYWITIGKDIVWDFPKICPQEELDKMYYPELYWGCTALVSDVLRAYIDCPRNEILSFKCSERVGFLEDRLIGIDENIGQIFDSNDNRWGLIPILQACDRRIGKEKRRQIASKISEVSLW